MEKGKNLLLNKNELIEKEIDYYQTNRGGDITFHGPGQIVGYPILDLDNFFTDIHKYLRFLEELVILTLKEYNLNCQRSQVKLEFGWMLRLLLQEKFVQWVLKLVDG